jgi:hypothetical protein
VAFDAGIALAALQEGDGIFRGEVDAGVVGPVGTKVVDTLACNGDSLSSCVRIPPSDLEQNV